jgi:4-amino-4-deoxy-L-arabinose transferase-like glycosyltransferase
MRRTARIGVLAAVVAGLALRVVLAVAVSPAVIGGDPRTYDGSAAGIAAGHGYVARGRPTAAHPPGWPYLLGAAYAVTGHDTALDQRRAWDRTPAVGRHRAGGRLRRALAAAHRRWLVGRLLNALLGAVAVGLAGLLGLELFSPAVGVTAAALAAVAPPLPVIGLSLLSEPLFIVLELAALLAAARYRRTRRLPWALAAGVLGGLATLTRANGAVLLAPLLVAAWPRRAGRSPRGFAPAAALACAFVLTVVPWTVRNAAELHAFVPVSTDLGRTLAGTYNATAPANDFMWRSPARVSRAARTAGAGRGEAARSAALTRLALRYIAAHPLAVPEATAWNTYRMLELYPDSRAILGSDVGSPRLATISVAGFAVLLALALLGACTRTARRAPAFLWLTPLLLWLSTAPFAVNFSRFRSPIDPFLVLAAACGIATLLRRRAAAPTAVSAAPGAGARRARGRARHGRRPRAARDPG